MKTLRAAVEAYLTMRRGLGFKLLEAGKGLSDFASFLEERGVDYITTSLALEWAQQPSSVLPAEWARRLSYVRGFARYQSAIDSRTEIPPARLLPHRPRRAKPYLYTELEIKHLLNAALNLPPVDGLRGWTFYTLLGLLVVSGVRISEAVGLKLEDVDLSASILTVRGSKFGKSRLVPLHDSTRQVLANYKLRRDDFLTGRPAHYFFISPSGNRLNMSNVHRTFNQLSRQIGIRDPDSSTGPRLHDLRHRFAIETLLRWYRAGEDVERHLPILSAYLGHVNVSDTYWYLTACPELMGLAVERLEHRWEVQS
jgi:integrase/recombinase XerD